MLHVTPEIRIPLREFHFSFARSSGPGGQNVNKVSSKALLHWSVADSPSLPDAVRRRLLVQQRSRITAEGELLISSQRFRDAGRNVADCLEKLRQMLFLAANPPKPRKPSKPTRGSIRRRLEQKQRRGQKKQQRRLPSEDGCG
jgi:ribosome-associated protein